MRSRDAIEVTKKADAGKLRIKFRGPFDNGEISGRNVTLIEYGPDGTIRENSGVALLKKNSPKEDIDDGRIGISWHVFGRGRVAIINRARNLMTGLFGGEENEEIKHFVSVHVKRITNLEAKDHGAKDEERKGQEQSDPGKITRKEIARTMELIFEAEVKSRVRSGGFLVPGATIWEDIKNAQELGGEMEEAIRNFGRAPTQLRLMLNRIKTAEHEGVAIYRIKAETTQAIAKNRTTRLDRILREIEKDELENERERREIVLELVEKIERADALKHLATTNLPDFFESEPVGRIIGTAGRNIFEDQVEREVVKLGEEIQRRN